MPEMDGYQTTKAIRRSQAGENNKNISIIAMTANAMLGDKEKCLNVGMNDHLSKPIDPAILYRKISNITCKCESLLLKEEMLPFEFEGEFPPPPKYT